jgi:hypothetical protein
MLFNLEALIYPLLLQALSLQRVVSPLTREHADGGASLTVEGACPRAPLCSGLSKQRKARGPADISNGNGYE